MYFCICGRAKSIHQGILRALLFATQNRDALVIVDDAAIRLLVLSGASSRNALRLSCYLCCERETSTERVSVAQRSFFPILHYPAILASLKQRLCSCGKAQQMFPDYFCIGWRHGIANEITNEVNIFRFKLMGFRKTLEERGLSSTSMTCFGFVWSQGIFKGSRT
jgi:hypothetical protein